MKFRIKRPGQEDQELGLSETHEVAWNKLPVDIRRRAVARLQATMDPSFFEEVRKLVEKEGLNEWLPVGWHFGPGMAIRNLLRSDYDVPEETKKATSAIKDEELPAFDEYYGEGTDCRNWDDYYVQCIEAAAGLRPVE